MGCRRRSRRRSRAAGFSAGRDTRSPAPRNRDADHWREAACRWHCAGRRRPSCWRRSSARRSAAMPRKGDRAPGGGRSAASPPAAFLTASSAHPLDIPGRGWRDRPAGSFGPSGRAAARRGSCRRAARPSACPRRGCRPAATARVRSAAAGTRAVMHRDALPGMR